MEIRITEKIKCINKEFYRKFANSFSSTRNRIQPGVARLLTQIPEMDNWLDIGCGNGTLAKALVEQGRSGHYVGCDFSLGLIEAAREKISALEKPPGLSIDFEHVDINQREWTSGLPEYQWSGVSLFAVLHHIPSSQMRQALFTQIRTLLPPGKSLYLSVWQLQNSPRLLARVKPWQSVGIKDEDVDTGDVLMDWRAGLNQNEASEALRYVHIFNKGELSALAENANFRVMDFFYSDGKEGNLAIYQIWK